MVAVIHLNREDKISIGVQLQLNLALERMFIRCSVVIRVGHRSWKYLFRVGNTLDSPFILTPSLCQSKIATGCSPEALPQSYSRKGTLLIVPSS